jgi:hypothetical protein
MPWVAEIPGCNRPRVFHTQCRHRHIRVGGRGDADELPPRGNISTRFDDAIPELPHLQSLGRPKMATHPCVSGNADLIGVSLEPRVINAR